MTRRIWVPIVVMALTSVSLPAPLFASGSAGSPDGPILQAARAQLQQTLQQAPQQAQQQPQTGGSYFSTATGKLTLVAIAAASIVAGIAFAKGPEPRQWP
jgi:hypothetical protein